MKFLAAILSLGFIGFSAQAAESNLKCRTESGWVEAFKDRNLQRQKVEGFEISLMENNADLYQLSVTSKEQLRAKDPSNISKEDQWLIDSNSKFNLNNFVIAKDLKCQFSEYLVHCRSVSNLTNEDLENGLYVNEFVTSIESRKSIDIDKARSGTLETVESSKVIFDLMDLFFPRRSWISEILQKGFSISSCQKN